MLPDPGSICMGVDSRNHSFAPVLPPGPARLAQPAPRSPARSIYYALDDFSDSNSTGRSYVESRVQGLECGFES